jgi:hypothetical protein
MIPETELKLPLADPALYVTHFTGLSSVVLLIESLGGPVRLSPRLRHCSVLEFPAIPPDPFLALARLALSSLLFFSI